jgi:protein-L-isoaspartate(D-aspartate) O-methyltransferase
LGVEVLRAIGLAPDVSLPLSIEARVLEIGTGSGYQAAVLSELTPNVFTIEILADLADRARAAFDLHGYRNISVLAEDGCAGWPEEQFFDAILVTAAPERVPPKLVEQLKPGGRMCIPVGADPTRQSLLLIRKQPDGSISEDRIAPVRFVRMTGGRGGGEGLCP